MMIAVEENNLNQMAHTNLDLSFFHVLNDDMAGAHACSQAASRIYEQLGLLEKKKAAEGVIQTALENIHA